MDLCWKGTFNVNTNLYCFIFHFSFILDINVWLSRGGIILTFSFTFNIYSKHLTFYVSCNICNILLNVQVLNINTYHLTFESVKCHHLTFNLLKGLFQAIKINPVYSQVSTSIHIRTFKKPCREWSSQPLEGEISNHSRPGKERYTIEFLYTMDFF